MLTKSLTNKTHILFFAIFLFVSEKNSQQINTEPNSSQINYEPIPLTTFFHKMDDHVLGSFTRDYGLPHLTAIIGSYGIVESGIDWEWYLFTQKNRELYDIGFASVEVGAIVPISVPVALYFYGRFDKNNKLQTTAFALAQSALISLGISSAYKAITARRPPENEHVASTEDYSTDFKFGLFNRGVFDGWPSGHTMTAFAMATTLMELYPDNDFIQIGAITYASLIGLGVSTNIHWFSDAFAGALIGYSIGKTVGEGFNELLSSQEIEFPFSFYAVPNGVGFTYRF